MNAEILSITIFVTIQMMNVILSTIKSILTVNGSRWTAAWINAISYTFGAVITKLITRQSFEVVIIVTLFTNLIGVYVAKLIMDKTRRPRLWTVSATLREANRERVETDLRLQSIQYTLLPAMNDRYLINIFSYSKHESHIIQEILDASGVPFTITENRKSF